MMHNEAAVKQIISLMDLTSLNENDTEHSIALLCARARTPFGLPAALCLYPAFIETAHRTLTDAGTRDDIRIATVTNFPHGGSDAAQAAAETRAAVERGADEVDVVFPWQALQQGNDAAGRKLVRACRAACGRHVLKVILETGALQQPDLIRKAAAIAIEEQADFIKTSTGKVPVNATPAAARIMLQTIADTNPACGFKAAGGVRTLPEAQAYLEIAAEILGSDWISPAHFRFGASSLLDNLLAEQPSAPIAVT